MLIRSLRSNPRFPGWSTQNHTSGQQFAVAVGSSASSRQSAKLQAAQRLSFKITGRRSFIQFVDWQLHTSSSEVVDSDIPGYGEEPGGKRRQVAAVLMPCSPRLLEGYGGEVFGHRIVSDAVAEEVVDAGQFLPVKRFPIGFPSPEPLAKPAT
jgi:hypothetical protein